MYFHPLSFTSKYQSLQEQLGKGSGSSSAQAAAFQLDQPRDRQTLMQADSCEQQHLQLLQFSQGTQT